MASFANTQLTNMEAVELIDHPVYPIQEAIFDVTDVPLTFWEIGIPLAPKQKGQEFCRRHHYKEQLF